MDDRKLFSNVVSIFGIPNIRFSMFGFVLLATFALAGTSASADDSHWIWSPKKTVTSETPQGECFFRKKFTLVRPELAEMELSAGDEYEVHINGRLAARGQSYSSVTKFDIAGFMEPGVNLIAAKVRHNDGSQVGLAIRIRVKEEGETRWRRLITDTSWKTRTQSINSWQTSTYNDLGWLKAQSLGLAFEKQQTAANAPTATQVIQKQANILPKTTLAKAQLAKTPITRVNGSSSKPAAPYDSTFEAPPVPPTFATPATEVTTPATTPVVAPNPRIPAVANNNKSTTRFEVDSEFTVQTVLGPNETGSLIAMEFNEFGKLLLSREGGPLLIADPTKPINDPERVRVYCDQVNTCQGILPLNGNVYVTANGPEGSGLYVLADANRDGQLEVQKMLTSFSGATGEHGPHGLRLGPDGMIYVILGNGCQIEGLPDLTSPYRHTYEGDLIPRFEDPGGHAVGVKAPGGTIVRISLDGKKVETVAGGIRNAYDMVFDQNGELFIHDSDMESDIGTTWYRPTMVFHVPAGAEFGWRSGSAKFATHFADQTPPICETGRGSPTGAALYQHLQFPIRYHDTMFLADWSEGRILALRQQPEGAGYVATTETFLKGRPLNVCDLTVGEDGALYFCTGGRGTSGGVYRVVWNGTVPSEMMEFESDLAKAIRHPQPNSAWSRQNIAQIKIKMGQKEWNTSIVGVAKEKRNSEKLRMRALQLMVLYGPQPNESFLQEMAQDESNLIRGQIARLCGLSKGTSSESTLRKMATDDNPTVRRLACESLMRLGAQPELSTVLGMLSSNDRIESLTARRLIERVPAEQWEQDIFSTDNKRTFIQGSIALMTAEPTLDRSYQVLAKSSKMMEGFINDYDFVDLLRTMELALLRGKVEPSKVPGLIERIGNEFPSGNSQINQELVRLLAYLKVGDLSGRIEEYLDDPEVPQVDKVHLGAYLQAVGDQLTPEARMAIINSLERASAETAAGGSYKLYLQTAVKRLSEEINNNDANYVLKNGEKMPTAVIAAFYKLPQKLDAETVQLVIDMDQRMSNASVQDTPTNQARLGVIAVLARSGDQTSMDYLRQIWQEEPARRTDISIGLAQQPEGANWAYLVSSIPILDDLTGIEVLEKLTSVARRPREPKHFSDVISLGYRMHGEGTDAVVRLLEHWSGEQITVPSSDWQTKLGSWQTWYEQKFPQGEKVQVQQQQTVGRYSVGQLLTGMQSGMGDAQRGHALFTKAQCSTCHRVGNLGENVGPDLTNLAQRFSMREAIESTIDPSKVIPDRYASKKILTTDGNQFTGMAIQQADGSYFVLQSDGRRIRINADEVEQVVESTTSAMPTGLLDGLSESEIKDLFTFMMQSQTPATASTRANSESVSQVEVAPVSFK